jgi:hypothetical protein
VSLYAQHAASGFTWRNSLQICTAAANTLNNSCRQLTRGYSPNWGLGKVLTTPHSKNLQRCKTPATDNIILKTGSTITTRSVFNSTLLSVSGASIKLNRTEELVKL